MFGFIGNIGPWELVLILLIALIVVGPGKLPEVAKSLGKGIREFKKATTGVQKEFQEAMSFDDDVQKKDEKKEPQESLQDTDTAAENNISEK